MTRGSMKAMLKVGVVALSYSGRFARAADKKWVKEEPAAACGDITKQQKGLWIDMGDPDINIKMSNGCTDENQSRCTVWCSGFSQSVVFDRRKESEPGKLRWDRRVGLEKEKKWLAKCMCEVTGQDAQGDNILENCRWDRKRKWNKRGYMQDHDLRVRRDAEDPESRATLYCEEDTAQSERDTWVFKPDNVTRSFKSNKGYTDCGDMTTIFAAQGGEWRCRDSNKNKVDGTVAPFKGACQWGCRGADGKFEKREARFTCFRPWIARDGSNWADRDIWRRFKGIGIRVYRQNLMKCD